MKKLIDFDKEGFKKEVITNVKTLYRRPIEEATPQQVFQAVSYAVKDDIIDRWIATHKEYEKKNVKTVYYLSMEFLMGRALGNNLINLTYYDAVKEALDELEFEKLILAYDYSTRKNSRYMVLEEEPEMVEKDGYRYPALRFVKRRV